MKANIPAETGYCFRRGPLGSIAVLWRVHQGQPKIMKILLYRPEVPPDQAVKRVLIAARPAGCREIDQVADQIEAFLGGADIRFSLDRVLLDRCSAFQQKVLLAEYGIPRGYVSTYQLIAAWIGKPAAARAVGTALATNPFPIIIPCHRAIRSDRTLGGFQSGLAMKRALLEAEGIGFDHTGRVEVKEFFYSPPAVLNQGSPQMLRRGAA